MSSIPDPVWIFLKWPILGSSGHKPTQKQPKITFFAVTKTFENLILVNYRSDINENCLVGVPP